MIKELLDTYIGLDNATYIGVGLGLISLLWGAKKILKSVRVTQKAKVSNGGSIIQVAGNFKGEKNGESKSKSE
ncbi:hypothetical protein [Thorsellia anophelis]|uniref:Uncharacterized protein n=1 Tax=Thorsellia anophelis DSM 18579 TaxID=1123402 RepID=A0A1I0CBR6_9GAMM|nr:hypothetical protein [Thorsellia anophelis]SET16977.1 hypothetical protein SAMN02583745_01567 [Thorsellia anophelis DSM 18579]